MFQQGSEKQQQEETRRKMMEEDNDESFSQVLAELKRATRDPRSIRLAAVTSALIEVMQDPRPDNAATSSSSSSTSCTAAKLYAKAVTALEGTLQEADTNNEAKKSSTTSLHETIATQIALLELLHRILPFVTPAAIVTATLPLTSRVLRALVASSLAIEEGDGGDIVMETKDELGGINAVLRSTCRVTSKVLQQIHANADPKVVRQLLADTLLLLFHDRRPKVRKAAQAAVLELLLLQQSSPASSLSRHCHPSIPKVVTNYAHAELLIAKKQSGEGESPTSTTQSLNEVLHLLGFLEQSVLLLDDTKLGDDMMELLAKLIRVEDTAVAAEFVSMPKVKDEAPKIIIISAVLTTVTAMLKASSLEEKEEEDQGTKHNRQLDSFATRVLASLLAVNPSIVFRSGSADYDLLERGRILYGQTVLASCQRVMASNSDLACRLLPLSIQLVVLLSKPSTEAIDDPTVAQTLMVELTQLFRHELSTLVECQSSNLATCLKSSLSGLVKVTEPLYRPTWSVSLQALVVLLSQVNGHCDVGSHVKALLTLRNQVPAGSPSQHAVEEAVSSLVQAVGVESCWTWLDFVPQGTGVNDKGIALEQTWILPVLKSAMAIAQPQAPRLAFFQQQVLVLARVCDKLATTSKSEKNFHQARVVDLWSLLSSFCVRPSDLATTLPALTATFARAIEDKRYPQLVTIICSALKSLCTSVRENGEPIQNDQDRVHLRDASVKLLPVLFKLVSAPVGAQKIKGHESNEMDFEVEIKNGPEVREHALQLQSLVEAIAALAGFASEPFLLSLFKKLMNRLLEEVQSEKIDSERICSLLTLSQALVAGEVLDEDSISFLYRALKPFIRNDEHDIRVQKRAYKVLAEICERYHSFVCEVERLKELTSLLTHTIMTSQVSARHMRLKCMCAVVDGFDDQCSEQLTELYKASAEIMLCLKDPNAKTREAAHQLIISLATKDIARFINVIAAALGAETSHMRSAAVVALSRIIYDFAQEHEELHSQLPSLLGTILIMIDENSREVVKGVLGFIRVCIAVIPPESLEPILPELVKSLTQYSKVKSRFRPKTKIILKKLVKHFGYDALMPYVPECEARLLTHMRKLDERRKRKKEVDRASRPSRTDEFDRMLESDEEDSDDGRTLVSGATGLSRMTNKTKALSVANKSVKQGTVATKKSLLSRKVESTLRLSNEADGEVVDMLGANVARMVKFAEDQVEDSESGDEMEFDDEGRLVVPSEKTTANERVSTNEDFVPIATKRRRLGKGCSDEQSRGSEKRKGSKSKTDQKRQELGAAYKSKKAGGDVKKKDQRYEPYAFVPLDGRSYTKKNRRHAVDQMSAVVRKGGKRKQC